MNKAKHFTQFLNRLFVIEELLETDELVSHVVIELSLRC